MPKTSTSNKKGPTAGIEMATSVLNLDENYTAILSLGGCGEITKTTSTSVMRKAYLKISLLIHPDKLKGNFPQATKAFQTLVSAYEHLSSPEQFLDEIKKTKTTAVMRSNEGCFRTTLFCPRCDTEWGRAVSGVEKYDYNFIMTGLTTYMCSTCLLNFGCMAAKHLCPFCHEEFAYHPSDYHRKITCGNKKCYKEFGFMIYHVSLRRENELRAELRTKMEKKVRLQEAQARRAARATVRLPEINIPKLSEERKSFIMSLMDVCPQCGADEVEEGKESRKEHLKECSVDKKQMKRYAAQRALAAKKEQVKKNVASVQDDIQGTSTWEYLGGNTSTLWLLSTPQLTSMCTQYGLKTTGDRTSLIKRVAKHRNALDTGRLLTNEAGGGDDDRVKKKQKMTVENLPDQLESFSAEQLVDICAAQDIDIAKSTKNKKDILKCIYKAMSTSDERLLLIE